MIFVVWFLLGPDQEVFLSDHLHYIGHVRACIAQSQKRFFGRSPPLVNNKVHARRDVMSVHYGAPILLILCNEYQVCNSRPFVSRSGRASYVPTLAGLPSVLHELPHWQFNIEDPVNSTITRPPVISSPQLQYYVIHSLLKPFFVVLFVLDPVFAEVGSRTQLGMGSYVLVWLSTRLHKAKKQGGKDQRPA